MKGTSFVRCILGIAVAVSLLSCNSGGGSKDFEFGGRWGQTGIVTKSNVSGNPVGLTLSDIMIIAQNGNNVTVKYASTGDMVIMIGTCDPGAKTFSATGIGTGRFRGERWDIAGTGVGNDSMSGAWSISLGRFATSGTWTADLASRTAAAPATGSGAGTMASLLKGFSR